MYFTCMYFMDYESVIKFVFIYLTINSMCITKHFAVAVLPFRDSFERSFIYMYIVYSIYFHM